MAADRGFGSREGEEEVGSPQATLLLDGSGNLSDKDPMIKRLGHYMALLGPRYKLSKELIWEKAKRGEMSAAQRRLHKQGGIEAVMKREGGMLSNSRSDPSVGEVVATDSDGKARAAWLAARATERDRGARASTPLTTKVLAVVS
jgi:hypothetical protein